MMRKTYNINLNSQVFYIDDNAYIQLQNYIETLEKYYFAEVDGKEIMMDIESRIAELFKEFLQKSHREVVSQADINKVIEIMGTPDAIIDEDSEHHSAHGNNIRKLYRDPDDAIIGGVAAGLAGYFAIPVVWIRLVFLVCALFYGISFFAYLILWIILPQATTAKEKLEMKGEKINVSNLEKNIRDTYNKVKTNSKFKNFTDSINRELNAIFGVCKDIFGKSLALIFSVLSAVGMLTGIAGIVLACWGIFFSYHFAPENYYTFFRYAWAPVPMWLIKLILLLVTTIPFFLLTYYSIRYLFKFQERKGVFLIFTGIWILCCISGGITGIYQARNYAQEYQSKAIVTPPASDTPNNSLYITFESPEKLQYTSLFKSELDKYVLHCPVKQEADSAILYLKPQFAFVKANIERPEVIIEKQARGFSGAEAIGNTENMQFKYEWKNDTLRLDDYFKLNSKEWRVNRMYVKIRIPENYRITLNNPPRDNIYNPSVFKDRKKFLYQTPSTQAYRMTKGKLVEIN